VNVRDLFDHLVQWNRYPGSYRSVPRFARANYPGPKVRTYRRVEAPPGAQAQTDWGEYPSVDLGDGPEALRAFVMVLSHSRMVAIVWSRSHDLVIWLRCHKEAYRRLGGIAAVNRIDNVKNAVSRGSGAFGRIHPTYRAYARALGFHVDACEPGEANAKGKTEAKVRLSRLLTDGIRTGYDGLGGLQAATDARVDRWARQAICPATGKTVFETWREELEHPRPLPLLPEPFDVAVVRPVHRDCTVNFEGRQYSVPFRLGGGQVEVRGCAGTVQVLHGGQVVREYPRGTEQRLLLDPICHLCGRPDPRAAPRGRDRPRHHRRPLRARPRGRRSPSLSSRRRPGRSRLEAPGGSSRGWSRPTRRARRCGSRRSRGPSR
jgi:transposase